MFRKKIVIYLVTTFIAQACFSQERYLIKGHFTEVRNGKIVLLFGNKSDTTIVKAGDFTFKGTISEPQIATFQLQSFNKKNNITSQPMVSAIGIRQFFLESGNTVVKGQDLKTATISGGQAQKDYLLLQKKLKPIMANAEPFRDSILKILEDTDKTKIEEMLRNYQAQSLPKIMQFNKQGDSISLAFVRQHPRSFVSLNILLDNSKPMDPTIFIPLFNKLDNKLKKSVIGTRLAAELAVAIKTMIGKPAPPFTQKDTSGVPVSLASLKGKYILLDFWASWCTPCRAENPNVVKAYNKYKNKNFVIVSISLDVNRHSWLTAINQDGMPWIHLSDLKGRANKIALQYGVNAIPYNFLIDPHGIIIARNLRGDDLKYELNKFIGQ